MTLHLAYPNRRLMSFLFFFNATATTEIYTLSLHDALPIFEEVRLADQILLSAPEGRQVRVVEQHVATALGDQNRRSEEHTSELQSRFDLVCRLLLEKKKRHRPSRVRRRLRAAQLEVYSPRE